jgi:hypothetical protein
MISTIAFASAFGIARPNNSALNPITHDRPCFWGVQGVFQHVEGVTSAVSGYAGGDKATAQYEKIGSSELARHFRAGNTTKKSQVPARLLICDRLSHVTSNPEFVTQAKRHQFFHC